MSRRVLTEKDVIKLLPKLKEAATNANNPNVKKPMEVAIKWINTATPDVVLALIDMLERQASELEIVKNSTPES